MLLRDFGERAEKCLRLAAAAATRHDRDVLVAHGSGLVWRHRRGAGADGQAPHALITERPHRSKRGG
jgi:hypothetical protein